MHLASSDSAEKEIPGGDCWSGLETSGTNRMGSTKCAFAANSVSVDPPDLSEIKEMPHPSGIAGSAKTESSGQGGGSFPLTRWSLIRQLQVGGPLEQRAGWERLCTHYWKPVYVWLRARGLRSGGCRGPGAGLLFPADWRRLVEGSKEDKGRLRTFLLVLLKRHAVNAWEYRQAKKRGGGQSKLLLSDCAKNSGSGFWQRSGIR